MKKLNSWILCCLSAGLLVLAFPRTDLWICAWGGLTPLMIALDGKKPWAAFRRGYFCGFLFFAGTLYWFFNITRWFSYIAALGVLVLLLYLALYFGLFALSYSLFSRRKPLFKLFLLPSVWAALEFIRAHLFSGFDWASLGHSQYKNLAVIQIADITGVFGVSFLIVMVNILFKEFIATYYLRKAPENRKALPGLTWVTALIVVVVLLYGTRHLSERGLAPRISVAIIQPNIPQEMKWQESAKTLIIAKQIALTKQAVEHKPDLIIWPETSYPDYLWEERQLFTQVQAFVRRIKTPLLLGSVIKEGDDYYNTAVLLSKDAEIVEVYRKVHLVPFGEFIPLRRFFPFISEVLDIGDFTRGKERTVFPFSAGNGEQGSFSVLVCFEDKLYRRNGGCHSR
jgi:apolipoprotein N-acyltransferase